ncbi:MAG: condensation domain-containing protein [Actinomycetota bacterium]
MRLRALDVTLRVDGDRLRYSAPSGVMTDDLREELVRERDELVALLGSASAPDGIEARVGAEPAPLTRQQELLLRSAGPRGPWNRPLAARIDGGVDVGALEHALLALVRRHEILHTIFPTLDGTLVQEVAAPPETVLRVVDARADVHASATAAVQHAVERPFDLATGPLIDVRLIHLPDEQVLVATLHPLLWDGVSRGLFAHELAALTVAAMLGADPKLPPLRFQYADYAHWQRAWLSTDDSRRLIEGARHALAGAPPSPRLEGARGPRSGPAGAQHRFRVPDRLVNGLRSLMGSAGVTAHSALLATFTAALEAATGQRDIVVGIPMSNRVRRGTSHLIGHFVNALPVRVALTGDPTFRDLIARVRNAVADTVTCQEVPAALIAAEHATDMGVHAPFSVTFDLFEDAATLPDVAGMGITPLVVDTGRADYDLTLSLDRRPDGLHGAVIWSTDVYDRAAMEQFAEQFLQLLESSVEHPDRRLSQLAPAPH